MVDDKISTASKIIPPDGGRGEILRGGSLISRAICENWKLPQEVYDEAPAIALDLAWNHPDGRVRGKMLDVLVKMMANNNKAKEIEWKINREESPQPNVNVLVSVDNRSVVATDERRARIYQLIATAHDRQRARGDDQSPQPADNPVLPPHTEPQADGVSQP